MLTKLRNSRLKRRWKITHHSVVLQVAKHMYLAVLCRI